jgi:hypothetical protein
MTMPKDFALPQFSNSFLSFHLENLYGSLSTVLYLLAENSFASFDGDMIQGIQFEGNSTKKNGIYQLFKSGSRCFHFHSGKRQMDDIFQRRKRDALPIRVPLNEGEGFPSCLSQLLRK